MRIVVMLLTDLLFLFETSVMGAVSLAKDREAWRQPGRLARSIAALRHSPFVSWRAVRILAEYHRPGFHPNDRDTTGLIAEWRDALFGRDGSLNAVLAG
jgi:predicted metal-dependent hydrolase